MKDRLEITALMAIFIVSILAISNPVQADEVFKFKNPFYLGDSINTVKIFNEKGVDELVILDINASKQNISPNFKKLEEYLSSYNRVGVNDEYLL